jgi:hypothetical protein
MPQWKLRETTLEGRAREGGPVGDELIAQHVRGRGARAYQREGAARLICRRDVLQGSRRRYLSGGDGMLRERRPSQALRRNVRRSRRSRDVRSNARGGRDVRSNARGGNARCREMRR